MAGWDFHREWIMVCIVLLSIGYCTKADAKRLNHEEYYQNIWCEQQTWKTGQGVFDGKGAGEVEHVLDDKARVDCLTNEYAVEFDFADKWAEAFGQASYYSVKTGKNPGIVLIIEDETKDYKYVVRLLQIIPRGKGWKVWLMFTDNTTQEIAR